jgi:FAD dependent oxidoreductase TIGR03364
MLPFHDSAGGRHGLWLVLSMNNPQGRFDLTVIGAGILGLATALAAVRQGLRVLVIDRDAQANGASVRNFGFITVSGQCRASMWARARRTREVWSEVSAAAGIPVLHAGLWVTARRSESTAVLEQFMATEMAEGCRLLSPAEARGRCPALKAPELLTVMESTQELRVESVQAIPRLAAWLHEAHGVSFLRNTAVSRIELPEIHTSRGPVTTDLVALCPGDDFNTLYAEHFARFSLTRCKLQMLRLADPGFKLPAAFMSDLGLARYLGFSALPAAAALKTRLTAEQPLHVKAGVHLIVVQSADGSLIVGDSHEYAATPDPFSHERVDALILQEFREALGIEPPPVLHRWTGTYASATDRQFLIDAPQAGVRIATVTSGAGASTGFAIGEEIIASLLEKSDPPK